MRGLYHFKKNGVQLFCTYFLVIAAVLYFTPPSYAALTDGLVSFWGLNESSGSRADNISGNTLTETSGTVPSTTGKVGNAPLFTNSVSGYLSVSNNSSFNMSGGDFSISLWAYLNNKTGTQVFASKYLSSGYAVYYEPLSSAFLFSTYAGGGITTGSALGDPTTGTWYHIVGVHDSVLDKNTIRINDQFENSVTSVTDQPDTTAPFTVGAFSSSGTFITNGRVDAVGLWNRKLTAGEITSLYNSGTGVELSAATPTPSPSNTPTPSLTPTVTPTLIPVSSVSTGSNSPSPENKTCSSTAPASAPDLFQIDMKSTSATLFFTPVFPVDSYMFVYGKGLETAPYGAKLDSGPVPGVMSYTINSLTPQTIYSFKVRGGNGCTPGSWSNTIRATTTSKGGAAKFYKNLGFHMTNVLGATSKRKESATGNRSCEYIVKSGDNLWDIATSQLGNGSKYEEILSKNKLPSSFLRVGQRLHVGC